MQLSKQEVEGSQVIVTTPEKWDVVTRKGGDGSLVSSVGLIMIDEVRELSSSSLFCFHRYVSFSPPGGSSSRYVPQLFVSALVPGVMD